MTQQKYELVKENAAYMVNVILYRIRALIDIPSRGVKTGDFGGYVQSEQNLNQTSSSWISGNALVFDKAVVSDDAYVSDNAIISGDAIVSGNACVFGNAIISGDAIVSGNAHISGKAVVHGDVYVCGNALIVKSTDIFCASYVGDENGTLTAYATTDGSIQLTRGCFTGTIDQFIEASLKKHSSKVHNEYKLLINVAKSRILG